MNDAPILISIITVNLNNEKGLAATIQSVLPQLSPDIEFLIIDGNSQKDNSVSLIHEVKDKLSFWCSEKDNGVYDAMNKGILQAKGEYLLFLNSGDILWDKAGLSKLRGTLAGNPDILSSKIIIETATGAFERTPIDAYTCEKLLLDGLPHQSTLIKRSLFSTHGLYDVNLRIAADWEFWLRLSSKGIRYKRTDIVLSRMEKEGMGAVFNRQHVQEKMQILKQYGKQGMKPNLNLLRLLKRNRKVLLKYYGYKIGISF